MNKAVEESEGDTDIGIAFDGTWQKRGFKSLNDVFTVTSVQSGKVLDVDILTKHCPGCKFAKTEIQKHKGDSLKNYEGSSGGMESVAVQCIFNRLVTNRGVQYVQFLGDGDSSAYPTICENNPYDVPIQKLECINHIQTRLGTRLRKLKDQLGKTKLEDGKSIQGKGRLTNIVIDKLQEYNGNALRSNVTDLLAMRKAVWAKWLHKLSTDESPQHQLCSVEWCRFKKAQQEGEQHLYKHTNSLPRAVLYKIKPIYQDLTHSDLLKKCLHGKTQNVNE